MRLKNRTIEDAILLLIIGQVVVFRFFNIHEVMNKVILAMILILSFINSRGSKRGIRKSQRVTVGTIAVIALLALNAMLYGINDVYISNLLMLFYPFMTMSYLTWYIRKHPRDFYLGMARIKGLINAYYVINIIVIFIQMQGNYFMVGFTQAENTMYEDLISGLFGYSMTHAFCYFSVFVTVYNLAVMRTIRSRSARKMYSAYNIVLVLINCYISLINDNAQYFVILPLGLMLFKFARYRLNRVSGVQKAFAFVLVAVFALTFLISCIPGAYEMLVDNVLYKITGSIAHMSEGALVKHGSMERLALLVYGFVGARGWAFGDGFSYAGLYAPYTYGFAHFGNANIGALVCLGGVWLFIAIIAAYFGEIIPAISLHLTKEQKTPYKFMIPIFLTIVALFSQPLTDISINLCIMFIICTLGLDKFLEELYRRNGR